jgi:TfoX/Sxy family transcriptional regulator of competence genes
LAYDEALAARVRVLLSDTPDFSERKMFGGLAFLVGEHMAVVASGKGGLMIRVDPTSSEELVGATAARFAEMRGRQMRGWLRLDAAHVQTPRDLAKWVNMSKKYVRTLPANI